MTDYREILRLKSLGYSQRQIERGAHSSHHTIQAVLTAAEQLNIAWPLGDDVTNRNLHELLFPEKSSVGSVYVQPDFPHIHRELAKSGVTLTLLWKEYCDRVKDEGGVPYQYTQFCEKYRKWAKVTKATMRITHKPGDVMQVDWAGNTLYYQDPVTGDEQKAYLFIAVLPCSCFAYAEACDNMQTETWLLCHIHAYNYFDGVTRLLVPDNLKTGIVANTRYDTVLNKSYQEMCEYYGTAIVPARVRHPKDKSLAEGTVKVASTWITAALRNEKFFSLDEVRTAVAAKLEELNDRPFQKRDGSRRSAYLAEEKEFMKPLPAEPYEPAVWVTQKVGFDYLVSDGKNKYSTPFDLIGENVDIRLTHSKVDIYYKHDRVASHVRLQKPQRDPVVKPEHMSPEHRKYLTYNASDFTQWAATIGENTSRVVKHFLASGKEPEQGYKACSSLRKMAERYGSKRLEDACSKIYELSVTPTIRNISTLLQSKKSDKPTAKEARPKEKKSYALTRGAAYYAKGGEKDE